MKEHPIEDLMQTAMDSISQMVDVNTIIGEPIETFKNIVIIPISKVGFGFAAGGSEFKGETVNEYSRKDREEAVSYRLPFGGGAGAGVSISPVAFLVVDNNNVKLIPVNHSSCLDKLLDYIPDLMEKANCIINKKIKQNEKDEFEEEKEFVKDLDKDIEIQKVRPKRTENVRYKPEYEENNIEVMNENYDEE